MTSKFGSMRKYLTVGLHALQKISDLRGSLGSGMDQGIVDPPFEGGAYVSAPALSDLTYPPP